MSMIRIQIILTPDQPTKAAEAIVHFTDSCLDGLGLRGFAVWREPRYGPAGAGQVSLPMLMGGSKFRKNPAIIPSSPAALATDAAEELRELIWTEYQKEIAR